MMKKQQSKKKGTPITWDQLSKLGDNANTPKPTAAVPAAVADSWEEEDVKDVKDISEPRLIWI